MNPGRPVVVNSLLCFLKNYREQTNILQIVDQYFTLESRRLAYQILLELLTEVDKLAVASSPCTPSILELYDRVTQSDATIPVFAAEDLTVLPLSLNYEDGVEQPKDLYNEVRQLRLYVHNALGQKQYSSPLWKRQNNPFDFASSNQQVPMPPSLPFIDPPLNTRPLTPTKQKQSTNDFNVSSLLKNDRTALQCSPTSSSSSTSSEIHSIPSTQQKSSQQRRQTNRPKKQHTGGNRLDKAVRKLTDRLLKTETNNNEEYSYENNNQFEHKNEEDDAHESNNNTIAAAFESSAASITAQIIQNFANRVTSQSLITTDHLDQLDELQNDDNVDMDRELGSGEFGQENEKTSSQSSPTPSDLSMNRDCNDPANDAEKPYVCSQFNCRKRFSNKFLLKKHQFIHTGLRPHCCPFCSKQFNRKDNLLRHKKTHLNNALAQISGRKRHNALSGVSEDSFHLFQQVNNLIEGQQLQFARENVDDSDQLGNLPIDKMDEDLMEES